MPSFDAHLKSCLEALYVGWEITHSEVIFTPDDPRLVVVEVNCRQTQYEFSPPHYVGLDTTVTICCLPPILDGTATTSPPKICPSIVTRTVSNGTSSRIFLQRG